MNFTLKIWRQENARAKGRFEKYQVTGISSDCSFLEMLDILNNRFVSIMTAVREYVAPAAYI
jgi:succinate dehydrogenase / fumarate reductase iron-sulfur subunit